METPELISPIPEPGPASPADRFPARNWWLFMFLSSLLIWGVNPLNLSLPFNMLNSILHEYGHALGGVLTGGICHGVRVDIHSNGVALLENGHPIPKQFGAYLFTALITGCCVRELWSKRRPWILPGLAIVLLLGFLTFGPGGLLIHESDIPYGLVLPKHDISWIITLGWAGVFCIVFVATALRPQLNRLITEWFVLQLSLALLYGFYVALRFHTQNDAYILSTGYGGDSLLWALSFVGVSLLIYATCLRQALKSRKS